MLKSTKPSRSRSRYRTGLSFVEVVVVLAIIGITTSVAVSKFFSAVQRHRVDSAARQLARDLQAAKRSAGSSGKDIVVNFDLINHRYSMVGLKSIDKPNTHHVLELNQAPFHCQIASVSLTGQQVTFNRFQQPNVGGAITLRCGTFNKVVQIDLNSGKVTIQ